MGHFVTEAAGVPARVSELDFSIGEGFVTA